MNVDALKDWLANPRADSKQGTASDPCLRRLSCRVSAGARNPALRVRGPGGDWVWSQEGVAIRDESTGSEGARPEPEQLPLNNMAARAASAQPFPMDRPGSISNRQLSGIQTPPANDEG
ncbi:hypothetical protein NN561_016763 [Cricetulus griseus]